MRTPSSGLLLILLLTLVTACSTPPPVSNTTSHNTTTSGLNKQTEATNPQEAQTTTEFGRYSGKVQTEWLDERKMTLLSDLKYTDPEGQEWLAPKGAKIDGASIPRMLWSMIGSPFSGKYRNASVIHDVACDEKKRPWQSVHRAFYHAMRASDVEPLQAKIMYAAVNNFGPRWGVRGNTDPRLSDADFNQLIGSIKQGETSGKPMTPEQIQNFKK